MNIFNSELLSADLDLFWDDVNALALNASPRPLLVIANEFAPDSNEEAQLKRMLEAEKSCGLSPEQYNIICLKEGQKAAWYRFRELLDPKIVFLVGVLPSQLGIAALFAINTPNNYDGRVWLPTVPLRTLEQNGSLKSQLWNAGMKPLFKDNKSIYF